MFFLREGEGKLIAIDLKYVDKVFDLLKEKN